MRAVLIALALVTANGQHVDGKGALKTASGAAKAVDTEFSASGVADELHKIKGVSEGSGDVVGASTDSFVARQQLAPKGPHVDGKKGVLKTTSSAAKAIDTEFSASGVADELHKTKGVSEGSGDVVGASTDSFVPRQELGPKGPHVDGKKGVLKTTSGAAKAVDTEASASWLETARVAATRFLGGVEGMSETMTLSKGTAVDGKGFDVHETATASTGDEFEKQGTAEFDADQEDVSEKHASFEVSRAAHDARTFSNGVDARRRLSCDYSVVPLTSSECPSSFPDQNDKNCDDVDCGQICEGDEINNGCGISDGEDNCPGLEGGGYDMYRKVCYPINYGGKEIRTCEPLSHSGSCQETCRYTDKNSCPTGFNIWVPEDYDEANTVRNEFGPDYTHLVGIFKTTDNCKGSGYDFCKTKMKMNSDWVDAQLPSSNPERYWKSVSRTPDENNNGEGSPWFVRKDGYSEEPSGDYTANTWLEAQRHDGGWTNGEGFNFNDEEDDDRYCYTKYLCEACPAGRHKPAGLFPGGYGANGYYCELCGPGTFSGAGVSVCTWCDFGQYASGYENTECSDCPAGKSSPMRSWSSDDCDFCDPGWKAPGGSACTPCPEGETSNSGSYADSRTAYTECVGCRDGEISSAAGGECEECPAGTVSNSAHTACETCGPGTFSVAGQADACTQCGDDVDLWKLENWDPYQSGLTSSESCECARGRTGTNCNEELCALTTPVVSLGFLVLEAQWPRFTRSLSTNEAFSGISGAFQSFDANDDNYLSIEEARRAIRAGGMAVPYEVTHIWSSDGVNKLYEDDVTIAEMVQDELARLEEQKTEEYYERPSGSGAIETMEATYPNNHDGDDWSNAICEAQNTKPPKLTWTVDRGGNDITVVKVNPGNTCGDGSATGRKPLAPSALAGTRCCGSMFDSFCDNDDRTSIPPLKNDPCENGAAPGYVTYEEAKATCEGVGARLCTPDELELKGEGGAKSTGCYFDEGYVWSNARLGSPIYQQCAFFNGVALTGTDGLDNDASSGKSNVASPLPVATSCAEEVACTIENQPCSKGTDDDYCCKSVSGTLKWVRDECDPRGTEFKDCGKTADECAYEFQLPNADGWPAGQKTVDVGDGPHYLGEVPTPVNYELSFRMAIDAEEDFDGWRTLIQVTGMGTGHANAYRFPIIKLKADRTLHVAQTKDEPSWLGYEQVKFDSETEFEAGKTYDIVVKNEHSKLTLYVDGVQDSAIDAPTTYLPPDKVGLLMVGWSDQGNHPAHATISDARFVDLDEFRERSYKSQGDCSVPGTFTYAGRTLRCVELPNGELVDVLEVEGGTETCKYTDTNSCPAGYDIWVPRSYEHAKAVVDAVDPKFTHLVGVYREEDGCGGCTDVAMNSDAYDEWEARRCTIAVESAGFDDGNTCSFTIESNSGATYTKKHNVDGFICSRGFNFLEINANDCSIVDEQRFDTHGDSSKATDMQAYVESMSSGTIVLVAVRDEASAKMTAPLKTTMAEAFGVQELSSLVLRDSYAAILVKGYGPGPLDEQHKTRYMGSAEATATIDGTSPFVRVPWTSVAGKPWFMREKNYTEPSGNYDAGCWLTTNWGDGWVEGEGFSFDDGKCSSGSNRCHSDYLCSRNGIEYLDISKHSYCVETKFCPSGTTDCKDTTADPALTVMRCTTGLKYDGTPMDIFQRMEGTQGVALSWLDTSTVATGYRVYKITDVSVPFAKDTSAQLLREFLMRGPVCGLRHAPLDFRDITTGGEPGLYVGYAVVPLDDDGVEDTEKVGESGFVVTWFGDVYVEVAAKGGGPVKDAIAKLSHLRTDGQLDPSYTDFVEVLTDEYGEAHLKVRVQDPNWTGLTQHFTVTVEKNSSRANNKPDVVHKFSSSSEEVTLRHLGQSTFEFTDITSRVISGTVSHDAFGAAYFAENCPHTKSEGSGECMCPVDGAEVYVKRASGGEEKVTLNEGKFATAVFIGETVTIGLRMYNGTNGDVPHNFSVAHDADNATVQNGIEPTFEYTATDDAEVHFLDTSTQTLAATYVVGANRDAAEYVNGVPVVAKVERCGWERPAWALRGVATFELGAAAVEVRALGDDEVLEGKYYLPPGDFSDKFDCDLLEKDDVVLGFALDGDERTIRGCRAKIPEVAQCNLSAPVQVPGCQTIERPCATMDYTYVDQMPTTRIFDVDLSVLGYGSNSTCAMYVPGPVVASQDNQVATVDSLENYELTFTMELADDWSIDGWQFILHIGDSQFERLPAIFFDPNGDLRAMHSDIFCDTCCCNWGVTTTDVSFEAGQTYEINVVVADDQMTVYVDGVEIGTAEGDATYTATNATVYVGSPWYDAAKVTLSDICLKEFAPNATTATSAQVPIEFVIASPLCLESVSAAPVKLQSLLTDDGEREIEYDLASQESLLTLDELPEPEEEGLYGKACTDNTNAVFREGDAVEYDFKLVEREPNCYGYGVYPWDDTSFTSGEGVKGGICVGYEDAPPSPDYPIAIRVADGVSRTDSSSTYDELFTYIMTAGEPNPFAPFSHELSVEFTRAFDGAEILFVRQALIVGVIPEEVPQVWTVATNPTLIFFVLRDPPGGGSFATLTEGSTISTSMAIDGSHAAELEDEWNFGASLGGAVEVKGGVCFGGLVQKNVVTVGGKGGFSYSRTPTDVTVERATSRHFDVGISFSTGISTSSSPHLPGQPSDIIVGGGANLRFISAIEIFAKETGTSTAPKLCLGGLTTKQFLPEQVSTWVMSVYEIEKTLERLGAALTDPNTKIEKKNASDTSIPDPRDDIAKQIENWQTVLANYRATTIRDQAESVADQLARELDVYQTHFQAFQEDMVRNANGETKYTKFLSDGLDKLGKNKFLYHRTVDEMPDDVKEEAAEEGVESNAEAEEEADAGRLGLYEKDVLARVNDAFNDCASTVGLVEPGGKARLCEVYSDIGQALELKSSLFGICDFAKQCCKDDSGECSCRQKACDDNSGDGFVGKSCSSDRDCGSSGGACACSCLERTCDDNSGPKAGSQCTADTDCSYDLEVETGFQTITVDTVTTGNCECSCCQNAPECAPMDEFCKRDHYRDGQKIIGAFDALHDTTQFITFSGSTGLEFSWDISESRGQELTSTHDATVADSIGGSFSFGANVGRRRLESADDRGVPGYAYPISGRVLARSKKLLKVTPEALERRRLDSLEDVAFGLATLQHTTNQLMEGQERAAAAAKAKPEPASNPCGRRLDGTKLSDEERRRLGVTGCLSFEGGTSSSFAVSLGRAASKDAEHSRSVSIFLGDDNTQDVFAVKISQDAVYGTPIFTTMGGRSSCVGETGTTRRDSRVTIKEIRPLCARAAGQLCDSVFACECKDLPPGEDAIFSVVLQNLSPWVAPVRPILRAVRGAVTAWDSGKYGRGVPEVCPVGDPGSLEIRAVGNEFDDLRNRLGLIVAPLPYGQFEVRVRISRYTTAPQCYSFPDIELELVAECEDTDSDDVQEVYQYQTSMDELTGDVTVIHPKFVGRPVGYCEVATEDLTPAALPNGSVAINHGTGRWCYSDLNLAVGCTESPAACWEQCSDEILDLNNLAGGNASASCPAAFMKWEADTLTCDVGVLEAVDWEEETGQCRCQNSCECTVEDLYVYDVTKNEGDPGYKNRTTTTHLLTAEGLELPKDEDGENVTCGLYTFKDDTVARGSATHKASFSVSWNSEVHGCTYEEASNYNPFATVSDMSCVFDIPGCPFAAAENYNPQATLDDGSCVFDIGGGPVAGPLPSPSCTYAAAAELLFAKDGAASGGCMYGAAGNYDPAATFDDGSCVFDTAAPTFAEAANVTGQFCMSGIDDADSAEQLGTTIQQQLAETLGVDPSQIVVSSSPDGTCDAQRRLQHGSLRRGLQQVGGGLRFSYILLTTLSELESLEALLTPMYVGNVVQQSKKVICPWLNFGLIPPFGRRQLAPGPPGPPGGPPGPRPPPGVPPPRLPLPECRVEHAEIDMDTVVHEVQEPRCKPCTSDAECRGICKFDHPLAGRRGLLFGSAIAEGCCGRR